MRETAPFPRAAAGVLRSAPAAERGGRNFFIAMKRIAALCALAALLCAQGMAQAVAKFEETKFNFGTFSESQPVTHEFVFQNTGDKPLVIQQAYASCGCTVVKHTKDPVAPGAKGTVTVIYNGKGKAPGRFKKAVTVLSNASNNMVRLYVEGNMEEVKKGEK